MIKLFGLRALLIQEGVKHYQMKNNTKGGLRALLIQEGVKLGGAMIAGAKV